MQSDHAGACFVRVDRCRFGSILGSILESFWGPSSLLCSFFGSFFSLSFVSLFWPPGRPKKSIVANLAPKMTPKWNPKWSRSDEGRPSRNMRRRGRIACPPPGEPRFRSFSETRKRAPKNQHNPSDFELVSQHDPKSAPRGLPKGAQNVTKI